MLSGSAAIARARAKTTNIVGGCLYEVWDDFGKPHDGRSYPTAYSAWMGGAVDRKRLGDLNPPAGAVCFYGPSPTRTDRNRNAGDVVISLGNGMAWCTDAGVAGRPGVMSLAARGVQIRRPYLGWGSVFFGQEIDLGVGMQASELYGWMTKYPDGNNRNLADGLNYVAVRQEEINGRHERIAAAAKDQVAAIPIEVLYNQRVQGRNLFDWLIQAANDRAANEAKDAARDAALAETIAQLAKLGGGGSIDPAALSEVVTKAAREGAQQAIQTAAAAVAKGTAA